MREFERPSNQEDEYFALEEVEKKHKLALKQAEELAARQRDQLRQLHHMKCPNCGMDLHALQKGSVEASMCFHCHGVWLNKGQLEKLIAQGTHESGAVMRAVL